MRTRELNAVKLIPRSNQLKFYLQDVDPKTVKIEITSNKEKQVRGAQINNGNLIISFAPKEVFKQVGLKITWNVLQN